MIHIARALQVIELPRFTTHLRRRHTKFTLCRWLHKLSERCKAWRQFDGKDCDADDVPQRFREVQGDADPPLSSYARCVEIMDMLDSVLPAEMCRTLTGLMFSIMMDAECEIEDAALGSQAPAGPMPPEMERAPSAKNGYAALHF